MQQNWLYKDRNANGIVDTYAHIAALIPNPYSYPWACVEAMDAVRNANNYRPKIYCVPDQTQFIPLNTAGMKPFSDFYTQIRMVSGTIVVGMSLTIFGTGGFNKQNNFYVQVVDDGSGIPFFTEWVADTHFLVQVALNTASITSRVVYNGKFPWFPLTKPRVVSEPGIVSVGLCLKYEPNTDPNYAPQVVLICLEPCGVFNNAQECQ
jgi:hypothetical protein